MTILGLHGIAFAAEIKGNIVLPPENKTTSNAGLQHYAISVTAYPLDKQDISGQNTKSIEINIDKNRFAPSFFTVYRGDTITFKNNDGVFHKIVLKAHDHEYSFMLKDTGEYRTHTYKFSDSGDWYLFCALHKSNFGWIRVANTPYITNLDQPGYFELTGLPTGRWVVQATGMDGKSVAIETHAFTSPPLVKLVIPVNRDYEHGTDKITVTNTELRQFFPSN